MKYRIIFILIIISAFAFKKYHERMEGRSEPWKDSQLITPADLAAAINNPNAKKPLIICVGPGALIKGSVDMGPSKEKRKPGKAETIPRRFAKRCQYCHLLRLLSFRTLPQYKTRI